MPLHLHLGAHKTGSTHLQATLRRDRAALEADGLRLVPPEQARAGRGGLAGRLVAGRRLARLTAGEGLTLASDENTLGLCAEIVAAGALYPDARARIALWSRAAEEAGAATVFLAIRDYAPFFSGVHAQAMRGGGAERLTEPALERMAALPRRWPDLVEDVRAALPGAAVTLWRFEDHEALAPRLLSLMTGGRPLAPIGRRPMATPSEEAMEEIFGAAAASSDGRIDVAAYDAARAAAPVGPDRRRYDPFDERRRARMAAAYDEDVARLRADPAVTFVDP